MNYSINGCELVETCGACPEQYDVFYKDELIGYLRLRHGYFYAAHPDSSGVKVYEAWPEGDGIFYLDEREGYLTNAVNALLREHSDVTQKYEVVDKQLEVIVKQLRDGGYYDAADFIVSIDSVRKLADRIE